MASVIKVMPIFKLSSSSSLQSPSLPSDSESIWKSESDSLPRRDVVIVAMDAEIPSSCETLNQESLRSKFLVKCRHCYGHPTLPRNFSHGNKRFLFQKSNKVVLWKGFSFSLAHGFVANVVLDSWKNAFFWSWKPERHGESCSLKAKD